MRVKFTSMVSTTFGGIYSAGVYSAREGEVLDLGEAEVSRLNRDHPGLIEPADKAKVEARRSKPAGKDRKMTGGVTK